MPHAASSHVTPKAMKNFFKEIADHDTDEKETFLHKVRDQLAGELSPGSQIFSEYADRKNYSHDLASIPPILEKMLFRTTPLLVIQPKKPADLAVILRVAKEYGLPVFPRGIASWGLGGAVPTFNGIVIDFSPLDSIISIDRDNLTVTVEAGARWGVIDETLKVQELQLAVTPTSRFSTVGGWIATGGYGLGSLGCGHLRNWVAEIKVATPEKGLITLKAGDEDFPLFFNTEGQIGLIHEVTLMVIPRHRSEFIHLLYFDKEESLFGFAGELLEGGIVPYTMNYKGANHLKELNKIWKEPLFAEKPSLLLIITDPDMETQFTKRFTKIESAPPHVARLLWHERYNPLKMHAKAPSLLASEVLIPLEKAADYIEKAEKLAGNFRVTPIFEFHFVKTEKSFKVLAMCLFNCDRRKMLSYYAYLALVPALTRQGIKMGGKPYGIGIWNVPFFAAAFSDEHRTKLIEGKAKYDRTGIMNPRKFIAIRSRFYDIPAKIFHPLFFNAGMEIVMAFSPLMRAVLPALSADFLPQGENFIEEQAFSCTGCGNCLTVCPAYRITGKESCSPRGKLALTRRYLHGKKLSPRWVQDAFFCTRCKNCEHVCQSRIVHTRVWDELEERLKKLNLHSEEKIREFIDSLPSHPEYLELTGIEKWVNL
ncbi:MAG: FAD-binding protein [Vulcanimicrobiota bacterium]